MTHPSAPLPGGDGGGLASKLEPLPVSNFPSILPVKLITGTGTALPRALSYRARPTLSRYVLYHLQGTYNLQLDLPSQQVQQEQNPFDIYLQRQAEGKTWRLLRREEREGEKWLSYSLYD